MFGFPAGCARADCTLYAEWALVSPGSDTLWFELEGTAEGWVAFGASADQVMGGNGIDDVFVCQRADGGDTVVAEDTYNPQSPRGNRRDTVSVVIQHQQNPMVQCIAIYHCISILPSGPVWIPNNSSILYQWAHFLHFHSHSLDR